MRFDFGITKLVRTNVNVAIKRADRKYGHIILRKLIPQFRIAIISVLIAILEVKKITEIKTNNGAKSIAKYGMKFR
jgi:hypothetical protein